MKKVFFALTLLLCLCSNLHAQFPQTVAQNADILIRVDSINPNDPCGNGAAFNAFYFCIKNKSTVTLQLQTILIQNLFNLNVAQSTNFYRLYWNNTQISGQNGLNSWSQNFSVVNNGTPAGDSLNLRFEIQPSRCFKLFMKDFMYYNNSVQITLPINFLIEDYYMCGNVSACTESTTEIDEGNNTNNFLLYPNPTSGGLTLTGLANSNIQILDVYGQVLYEFFCHNDEEAVDISALPTGIYFLNCKFGPKKVIKE